MNGEERRLNHESRMLRCRLILTSLFSIPIRSPEDSPALVAAKRSEAAMGNGERNHPPGEPLAFGPCRPA